MHAAWRMPAGGDRVGTGRSGTHAGRPVLPRHALVRAVVSGRRRATMKGRVCSPPAWRPATLRSSVTQGGLRRPWRLASSSVTLACRCCPGNQETRCGVQPGSGRGPPLGLAWDLQGAELDGGLAETQCLSLVVAKVGSGQAWGRHLILSKTSKRSTWQICPG